MKRQLDLAPTDARRRRAEPFPEQAPVLVADVIPPLLTAVLRCPDDQLARDLRACLHQVRNLKFVCKAWNTLVPKLLARPAPPFSPILAARLYWNQVRHDVATPSRIASLTGVLVTDGHADAVALRRLSSQVRNWQHLISSHCPPEFIDYLLASRTQPVSFDCAIALEDADHLDRSLRLVEQARQPVRLFLSPKPDYQPRQNEIERMVACLVGHDWKGHIRLSGFTESLITALDELVEKGRLQPESITGCWWHLTQGAGKIIEIDSTPLLPLLYPATQRFSFNRFNSRGLSEQNARRLLSCIAALQTSKLEELDLFARSPVAFGSLRDSLGQAFEVATDIKCLSMDGFYYGADNNPEPLIATMGKLKKLEECILSGVCFATPMNTINVLPFTGLLPHLPALKRLVLPVLAGFIDRADAVLLLQAVLHHDGLQRVNLTFSSVEKAATFGNIARGDDDHAQALMARFSMTIAQQDSLGTVTLSSRSDSGAGFTLPRRQ